MINAKTFRQLALAFPETVELPHFEKASFRVNKRIFATLTEEQQLGMIILSPEEQYVYCKFDPASFAPVPGKWGLKGCTHVHLKLVKKDSAERSNGSGLCRKLGKKRNVIFRRRRKNKSTRREAATVLQK